MTDARITELQNKVTTFGAKVPKDSQDARDIAHTMRVSNDEIRSNRATPNNS